MVEDSEGGASTLHSAILTPEKLNTTKQDVIHYMQSCLPLYTTLCTNSDPILKKQNRTMNGKIKEEAQQRRKSSDSFAVLELESVKLST